MRRSQAVVALLVSLIAWQGVMTATSAMSQDRPAGFQDFLRKGDVASLAAVIDKDPSLEPARRARRRLIAVFLEVDLEEVTRDRRSR